MRTAILFAMAAVVLSSAPLLWRAAAPQGVVPPASHAAQHVADVAGSLAAATRKLPPHAAAGVHAAPHPAR